MDNRITVGDKVVIDYIDPFLPIEGIVRYIPGDTGDMWHIETEGAIMAVNPMCSALIAICKRK